MDQTMKLACDMVLSPPIAAIRWRELIRPEVPGLEENVMELGTMQDAPQAKYKKTANYSRICWRGNRGRLSVRMFSLRMVFLWGSTTRRIRQMNTTGILPYLPAARRESSRSCPAGIEKWVSALIPRLGYDSGVKVIESRIVKGKVPGCALERTIFVVVEPQPFKVWHVQNGYLKKIVNERKSEVPMFNADNLALGGGVWLEFGTGIKENAQN